MSFELAVLAKTTVILLGAAFATAILRKRSASTRHAIWAAALSCVLLLPAASLLLPRLDLPVLMYDAGQIDAARLESTAPQDGSENPDSVIMNTGFVEEPRLSNSPTVSSSAHNEAWSSRQWVQGVWGAGAALFLLHLLFSTAAVRRLTRGIGVTADVDWMQLVAELRSTFSVSRPVDLRIGGAWPPMAWGIFRHVILLPESSHQWSPDRRRVVLAHELAHAKRNDGLFQMLSQIVCSVYWFSPISWVSARSMRVVREHACDDYVLNLGAKPNDYATHLLELAQSARAPFTSAAVAMASPSHLEARLRAILDSRIVRRRLSMRASLSLAGLATVLTLTLAAVRLTAVPVLAMPSFQAPFPSPTSVPQSRQPAPSAPAETPGTQAAAGELRGTVVDGATDRPLSRVSVGIGGTYIPTDADGRVSFNGLFPGKQFLSATRIGYLLVGLQRPRPDQRAVYPQGGIYVSIAPDTPTPITIYMLSAPVVLGTILDGSGQPVERAMVTFFRVGRDKNGNRTFERTAGGSITDDRGKFREEQRQPGEYILRVEKSPTSGRSPGAGPSDPLVPMYYPASTDYSKAEIVAVKAGETTELRPMLMQSSPGVTVHARLLDESGADFPGFGTWSFRRKDDLMATFIAASPTYVTLPAGIYEVEAGTMTMLDGRTSPAVGEASVVRATVELRGKELDLPLTLRPGTRVSGKIEIRDRNGAVKPVAGAQIRFRSRNFLSLDAFPFKTSSLSDGTFNIPSLPPGSYQLTMPLSGDDIGRWYISVQDVRSSPRDACLSEVRQNDSRITGDEIQIAGPTTSITVTLREATSRFQGKVVDAKKEPASSAVVTLVPDDNADRSYISKAADQNGGFEFTCAPVGNYHLYAWTELPETMSRTDELIAKYAGKGIAVRVVENGVINVQATVIEP